MPTAGLRLRGNKMQQYLDLMRDVRDNGVDKGDRTGVGTRSVFGRQLLLCWCFHTPGGFMTWSARPEHFHLSEGTTM